MIGKIWSPGLSHPERSLITISILTALGGFDGLRSHLETGIERRLTREDLTEAIMHMAFYPGWLRATSALFATTFSAPNLRDAMSTPGSVR